MLALSACNTPCQRVCQQVADRLASCPNIAWSEIDTAPGYGASDFVSACETTWDRRSAQLSARDLELSLDRCRDALDHLDTLSCAELAELYVPAP